MRTCWDLFHCRQYRTKHRKFWRVLWWNVFWLCYTKEKLECFTFEPLFTFEGKFFVGQLARRFVVVVVDINNKVYASIWIGRCKKGDRLKEIHWATIATYNPSIINEFCYFQSLLQNFKRFAYIQFLNCFSDIIPFLHSVTLRLLNKNK